MRVSQISVISQPIRPLKLNKNLNNQPNPEPIPQPTGDISFKAKFGAIIGGITGLTACIATVCVAPVAICFTAASAFAGALCGDAAEDAVNKKKDDN